MTGKRRSRDAGVYLIRVRRRNAPIGWPVFGRRNGYVGESANRRKRWDDHTIGSRYWNEAPKPWADLDPVMWRIPTLFAHSKWARLAQETFWTAILFPQYSCRPLGHRWPWSIAHVCKRQQESDRAMRGTRFIATYRWARTALMFVLLAGFVVSAIVINREAGWW